MDELRLGDGLSSWRGSLVLGACAVMLAAACARSETGGGGGSASTSHTATTSSGTGGAGGAGGATTSSSSSSTSTTSSSSSTSASGTGGEGGVFVQPPGTAEHPAEQEPNNLTSQANALPAGVEGFTAAVYPVGDVDIFRFTVTVQGSGVWISTSDGNGGCPAGAHTFVRVLDSSNGMLVTDSGAAGCISLDPVKVPSLGSLAPGDYYVHVESGDLTPIPYYLLDVEVIAPSCGDSVVQVGEGEQCDDSNMVSGDGCSATCTLESGSYLNETEPNDTQVAAELADGYPGAVGSISPVGDADWYSFHVTTPGSSVAAEISDGFKGCPPGIQPEIFLYSPQQNPIAHDTNSGLSPCSRISPVKYPAVSNLPVGVYAIKVASQYNLSEVPFYVLDLSVTPPGCGDGIRQPGEQCDDGGTAAGDGCSSTCQFEASYVDETEPNETPAQADPLPAGGAGFVGSINPAGDIDFYSFDVTIAGSSVFLSTTDGLGGCPANFDSRLTLYNPSHTQLAINDNGDLPPCSTISPSYTQSATNLPAGTYQVRTEYSGNNGTMSQYVVSVRVVPPGCGDSLLQPGEQCDDGDVVSGDGCSATCTSEAPYEIEPNDSTTKATPLWPGTTSWMGAISPIGDHDYYAFLLTSIGTPKITTHDAGNPSTCGFDTTIHLLDANGTEIAQDDDSGPGNCGEISDTAYPQVHGMQPGTYYVWVQRYNDTQAIPLYQLDLTIP